MTNLATTTLCFFIRDNQVLLAQKKRGFGQGWWDGYGGKIHGDETVEQALIREISEEAGVSVKESDLELVAKLNFYFHDKPEWNQQTHVYITSVWDGEPQETEEMKPQWFEKTQVPYSEMWQLTTYGFQKFWQEKNYKAKFTLTIAVK